MNDKTKPDKSDEFDFDFEDFGFDDDEFNDTLDDVPKNRNVAERIILGAKEGVVENFTSPSALKNLVYKALPDEYGPATELFDEATETIRSTYDEATRMLKPQVATVLKRINKIVPNHWEKTKSRLSSLSDSMTEYKSDYRPPTEEEITEGKVANLLKRPQLDESIKEESRLKSNLLDQQLNKNRHDALLYELKTISEVARDQKGYQDTILYTYHKKSLELQMMSLNAQKALLATFSNYSETSKKQTEAIVKNTAMPEYIKLQDSERFLELGRNRLMGNLQEGLFGDGSNIRNVGERLKKNILNRVTGVREAMSSANSAYEMMESSGIDRVQQSGNMASNYIIGAGLNRIKNKFSPKSNIVLRSTGEVLIKGEDLGKPYIVNKENNKPINSIYDISGEVVDNRQTPPAVIISQDQYNQGLTLSEGASNRLTNVGRRLSRTANNIAGFKAKLTGEGGILRPDYAATGFRGTIKESLKAFANDSLDAISPDKKVDETVLKAIDLNAPAVFDKKIHSSISETIPEYLAKILKELEESNGKSTTEELTPDYYTGKLITKSAKAAANKEEFGFDRIKEKYQKDLANAKEDLLKQVGDVDEETKAALAKRIHNATFAQGGKHKAKLYNLEDLAKDDTLSESEINKLKALVEKLNAQDNKEFKTDTLLEQIKNLARADNEIRNNTKALANSNNIDYLVSEGLAVRKKKGAVSYDYKEIMRRLMESDGSPPSPPPPSPPPPSPPPTPPLPPTPPPSPPIPPSGDDDSGPPPPSPPPTPSGDSDNDGGSPPSGDPPIPPNGDDDSSPSPKGDKRKGRKRTRPTPRVNPPKPVDPRPSPIGDQGNDDAPTPTDEDGSSPKPSNRKTGKRARPTPKVNRPKPVDPRPSPSPSSDEDTSLPPSDQTDDQSPVPPEADSGKEKIGDKLKRFRDKAINDANDKIKIIRQSTKDSIDRINDTTDRPDTSLAERIKIEADLQLKPIKAKIEEELREDKDGNLRSQYENKKDQYNQYKQNVIDKSKEISQTPIGTLTEQYKGNFKNGKDQLRDKVSRSVTKFKSASQPIVNDKINQLKYKLTPEQLALVRQMGDKTDQVKGSLTEIATKGNTEYKLARADPKQYLNLMSDRIGNNIPKPIKDKATLANKFIEDKLAELESHLTPEQKEAILGAKAKAKEAKDRLIEFTNDTHKQADELTTELKDSFEEAIIPIKEKATNHIEEIKTKTIEELYEEMRLKSDKVKNKLKDRIKPKEGNEDTKPKPITEVLKEQLDKSVTEAIKAIHKRQLPKIENPDQTKATDESDNEKEGSLVDKLLAQSKDKLLETKKVIDKKLKTIKRPKKGPTEEGTEKDIYDIKGVISKIYEKLNPKKDKFDTDNDGHRQGSWLSRKPKEKDDKKLVDPNANQPKEKKSGGLFSLLAGLSGLLLPLFGGVTKGIGGIISIAGSIASALGVGKLASGALGMAGDLLGGRRGRAAGGLVRGAGRLLGRGLVGGARLGGNIIGRAPGLLARGAGMLNSVGGAIGRSVVANGARTLVGAGLRTAASMAISAGGAAITGALSSISLPVVAGIAAVGAVGYGGYKLYKYLTDDKAKYLTNIRLRQYGFGEDLEDYHASVLELEQYVIDNALDTSTDPVTIDNSKMDIKSLLDIFKVGYEDSEQIENTIAWIEYRFKPIFLAHVNALKTLKEEIKLVKLERIKEKSKYVELASYSNGPYNVTNSPIAYTKALPAGFQPVQAAIAVAMEEIQKADKKEPSIIDKVVSQAKKLPFLPITPLSALSIVAAKVKDTTLGFLEDLTSDGFGKTVKDFLTNAVTGVTEPLKKILTPNGDNEPENFIYSWGKSLGKALGIGDETKSRPKGSELVLMNQQDKPSNTSPTSPVTNNPELSVPAAVKATADVMPPPAIPNETSSSSTSSAGPVSSPQPMVIASNIIEGDGFETEKGLGAPSPLSKKGLMEIAGQNAQEQTKADEEVKQTKGGASSSSHISQPKRKDEKDRLYTGKNADKYIKYKASDVTLTGLLPSVIRLFKGMAEEYGAKTGRSIMVSEGHRNLKKQERFWKEIGPPRAAYPGGSLHTYSALDISSADANKLESLGLLKKYGFTRPVGGEKWHIEPAGIQSAPKNVRKDLAWADAMIKLSPGHGGGGHGSITGTKLGSRNRPLQMKLLEESSNDGIPFDHILGEGAGGEKTIRPKGSELMRLDQMDTPKPKQESDDEQEKPVSGSGSKVSEEPSSAASSQASSSVAQGSSSGNSSTSSSTQPSIASMAPSSTKQSASVDEEVKLKETPKDKRDVLDIIAKAAKKVGLNPKGLQAIAAVESALRTDARPGFDKKTGKRVSTAQGLFQFLDDSWTDITNKHGKKYGIGPGTSRLNPEASAAMGAEYLKDNLKSIKSKVKDPALVDGYIAHFLGPTGAGRFFSADREAIAAKVTPKAAKSNPNIFFNKDGSTNTIARVRELFAEKLVKRAAGFGIKIPKFLNPLGDGEVEQDTTPSKNKPSDTLAKESGATSSLPMDDKPKTFKAAPIVLNEPNENVTKPVVSPKPAKTSDTSETESFSNVPTKPMVLPGASLDRSLDREPTSLNDRAMSPDTWGEIKKGQDTANTILGKSLDVQSKMAETLVSMQAILTEILNKNPNLVATKSEPTEANNIKLPNQKKSTSQVPSPSVGVLR